jgi:hypothetical protein
MFSLGAGPVPSLLLSEIFPSRIRAKALAVCMAVHWVILSWLSLIFLTKDLFFQAIETAKSTPMQLFFFYSLQLIDWSFWWWLDSKIWRRKSWQWIILSWLSFIFLTEDIFHFLAIETAKSTPMQFITPIW